jgi:hypothetical protein
MEASEPGSIRLVELPPTALENTHWPQPICAECGLTEINISADLGVPIQANGLITSVYSRQRTRTFWQIC